MPKPIPTTYVDIEKIVTEHRAAWENWPHGDVAETWTDKDGFLCVRYSDGEWYHYGQNESGELVWW